MYRYKIDGYNPVELFETLHKIIDRRALQFCNMGDFKVEWNEGSHESVIKDIRNCKQIILCGDENSNTFIFDCGDLTYWWCNIIPSENRNPFQMSSAKCTVNWTCWSEIRTDYTDRIYLSKRAFEELLFLFATGARQEQWDYILEDFII